MNKVYACIDLKSFYASVECVERGLDPLKTNLVVADNTRTEKTICLAVTPSLKQYGIGGRARLFEVVQKAREINRKRKENNNYQKFIGKSFNDDELKNNKKLELDYIVALPQMRKYMKYSALIYNVYLKYLSEEDIYVYSIDEIFCDITNYLSYYKKSPIELISMIMKDVFKTTGITATAGIGTNMYLAKVCMDIISKKANPNEIGVRIAQIDEISYRKLLWNHKPLKSFWRIGEGIAKKIEKYGLLTMGDIARCSIENENLLYKLLGVNAELLIDHAWGYEPTTIEDIKKYKPQSNSISSSQVLYSPTNYKTTELIVREMIDLMSLDLVKKKKITNQIVLNIAYDPESLKNTNIKDKYIDDITLDRYGREIPKHSRGTINIEYKTSSSKILSKKCIELYKKIIKKDLLVRKVSIALCNISSVEDLYKDNVYVQLDLFSSDLDQIYESELDKKNQNKDIELQNVMNHIKEKYGSNAIVKAMDLQQGATTIERNKQVGGHRG